MTNVPCPCRRTLRQIGRSRHVCHIQYAWVDKNCLLYKRKSSVKQNFLWSIIDLAGQNGITRSLPKPEMGQPDSNKGSYQKCQFLIVTLLAACHMGFVRCPYSNAVLKVWGEAIQRTWTKPPLITENILQSKRRRIVKQVWVGSEAVARLTVWISRRVDSQ